MSRVSIDRSDGSRRRGAVLVFLVVVIVLTGILALGVVSLGITSTESQVVAGSRAQASELAQSAVEYARWQYCLLGATWNGPLTVSFLGGGTATVDLEGGRFVATATTASGTAMAARAQAWGPLPTCTAPPVTIVGDTPDDYVVYSGGAAATFELPSGSFVDGSLFGPKVVVLPSNAEITGNIVSLSSVELGSGTVVGGYICAGGDLLLNSANTVVNGNVYITGNVSLDSATVIMGSVYATGNVTIRANGTTVGGDVHAGGNVVIENGAEVLGSVYATGSLSGSNSSVQIRGEAHAAGAISVERTQVDGRIVGGGNVTLAEASSALGGVWAANNIIQGSGPSSMITGGSFAGGTRNDFAPTSVLQSVPAPTAPSPPIGCPPSPPPPLKQVFVPGSPDIVVPARGSVTILPGTYGSVTIGNQSTTTLRSGGTYVFQSFGPAANGTTLRLDLSPGGRLTVLMTGPLAYAGRVEVSTDGTTWTRVRLMDVELAKTLSKHVYFETHSTFTIGVSGTTREWLGTVLADGNATLASGFYLVGAVATVNGTIVSSQPQTIVFSIADFALENWNPSP